MKKKNLVRSLTRPADRLDRRGLVQLVNRWKMGRRHGVISRGVFPPVLLKGSQWQRAAFIARQNKLLPEPIIVALTKHGTTAVNDPRLDEMARQLKDAA